MTNRASYLHKNRPQIDPNNQLKLNTKNGSKGTDNATPHAATSLGVSLAPTNDDKLFASATDLCAAE